MTSVFEVAVIGAGLSGLLCARRLQEAGYRVIVLEKSRGLGGRVATRRIADAPISHGLPFIEAQGQLSRELICRLEKQNVLQVWSGRAGVMDEYGIISPLTDTVRHVSQTGLTTVAKVLAEGLEIWKQQQVKAIAPFSQAQWELRLGNSTETLYAKVIVIAIPAPQALTLLHPLQSLGLPANVIAQIEQVRFSPCLAAIAEVTSPNYIKNSSALSSSWDLLMLPHHPNLKLINQVKPQRSDTNRHIGRHIWMIHSSPDFAARYLDVIDLSLAGRQLVQQALQIEQLQSSEFYLLHNHRWRYATCLNPLPEAFISSITPHPLVICGDWCGGKTIESALKSGWAASAYINQILSGRSLPDSI